MSCEAICKASTGTLTGGVTKTVAANVKKTGTLSFVTVKNRGSLSTSNCFSKRGGRRTDDSRYNRNPKLFKPNKQFNIAGNRNVEATVEIKLDEF